MCAPSNPAVAFEEVLVHLSSGRRVPLVSPDGPGAKCEHCESLFDPIAKSLNCRCDRLQLIVRGLAIEYVDPPVTKTPLNDSDVVTVVVGHGPECELEEVADEDWGMEFLSQSSEGSDGSSVWVPPPVNC